MTPGSVAVTVAVARSAVTHSHSSFIFLNKYVDKKIHLEIERKRKKEIRKKDCRRRRRR